MTQFVVFEKIHLSNSFIQSDASAKLWRIDFHIQCPDVYEIYFNTLRVPNISPLIGAQPQNDSRLAIFRIAFCYIFPIQNEIWSLYNEQKFLICWLLPLSPSPRKNFFNNVNFF